MGRRSRRHASPPDSHVFSKEDELHRSRTAARSAAYCLINAYVEVSESDIEYQPGFSCRGSPMPGVWPSDEGSIMSASSSFWIMKM